MHFRPLPFAAKNDEVVGIPHHHRFHLTSPVDGFIQAIEIQVAPFAPDSLRRLHSGSTFRFYSFRCPLGGVHFHYGLLVQKMPRLWIQPRGLIPGISFGREPSNSTGGTFTGVASGFPGARASPKVAKMGGIPWAPMVPTSIVQPSGHHHRVEGELGFSPEAIGGIASGKVELARLQGWADCNFRKCACRRNLLILD